MADTLSNLAEFAQSVGPEVIYAVVMAGMWLAITGIYVPGTGVPEALALVVLIIAGVGLIVLPANPVGVVMLVIALGCFLALIYFSDFWYLIVVGMLFQIIGSIFLFRAGSRPSIWSIILLNAVALAYHQIILLPGLRIQSKAKRLDADALIGMQGEVVSTLDPVGTVRIQGELWRAHSQEVVEAGQLVRVLERRGLELVVAPPGQAEDVAEAGPSV